MKPLTFLLLLFLSNFCFGQPVSDSVAKSVYAELLKTYDYRKNDQGAYDACKLGVDSAQRDLKNGILRYFFVGHALPYFVTAETYISKKYGIAPEFPGCSAYADIECYNLYVDKIINEKYGANFWKRAWQEIDSLQTLGQLDRPLSYRGDVPALHKDLFQLIKEKKLTQKTDSIHSKLQCNNRHCWQGFANIRFGLCAKIFNQRVRSRNQKVKWLATNN